MDDFLVCVDRIIASACFESGNGVVVVGGGGGGFEGQSGMGDVYGPATAQIDGKGGEEEYSDKLAKKNKKGGVEVIECRICQEDGQESDMEAPCACNGSLKFAHRKCIQRWCNKKGDITCEICSQVYTPNYSIPPSRVISDGIAIDIRQGWGPQIDLNDPRFLAIAAAEQQLLHAEYDYAAANNSGIAFCRTITAILLLLLLVRHALMVTGESGMLQDASAFFNVSLLQLVGFILPCYVVARSCYYIIQSRRHRQ